MSDWELTEAEWAIIETLARNDNRAYTSFPHNVEVELTPEGKRAFVRHAAELMGWPQ